MKKKRKDPPSVAKRIEEGRARNIARFMAKVTKAQEDRLARASAARKRSNDKVSATRRANREKMRWEKGDSRDWYNVILTKNKQQVRPLLRRAWKTDAYEFFSDMKANNKVLFPIEYEKTKRGDVIPVKYEVVLAERIDPIFDTTSSLLRNEYGKFIEHTVIGRDVQIIDKFNYYIEDDFYVYGYHPFKDRKTASFILNEIVLKTYEEFVIKRIYIFSNKLIIKSDVSLDIVVCKNYEDARRLYNTLLKETTDSMFVFFNYTPLEMDSPILKEVMELTGWNWHMIRNGNW